MAAYMLWYTLKDDILGAPSYILKILFEKCMRKSGNMIDHDVENNDMEKGYFGILTYFVQAASMMKLSLDLETSYGATAVVQEIEKYIDILLSIELSLVSYDLCPYEELTTTDKFITKLIFLIGIYVNWLVAFALLTIISKISQQIFKNKTQDSLTSIQIRLIKGLVEIIKYTYGGITSLVFMSLVCVPIGLEYVWFYDGTVTCLSNWQVIMVTFAIFFVLPFPLLLVAGMKLLREDRISGKHFLLGCVFPLPFLISWITMLKTKRSLCLGVKTAVNTIRIEQDESKNNIGKVDSIADEANEILNSLYGGYQTTTNAKYWESVMIFRRLFLGATILIQQSMVQMIICVCLSLAFLIHHFSVKPFRYKLSNEAESFSLILLCFVSVVNLLKSVYKQMGMVPDGPIVDIFKFLNLCESSFIVILICFIVACELKLKCCKIKR